MGAESIDPLTITPRLNPDLGKLEMRWPNRTNTVFQIQKQSASAGGPWNSLTYITGDAPTLTFVDEHAKDSSQLYRLEVTENPPFITTNLQRTLDTQKRLTGTKGACAAVITSNLTWIGTSGMSDPTNGVPLEPNMRFGMAGLTTMLTAAHLLQLQEEGKLSLDDPLSKWLPDFNNVTNTITLRQCLNHTAGIYDWYNDSTVFPNAFTNDWNKFWTPEDTLALIKRPPFRPGTSWGFSSMGFILAALVAEQAEGMPVNKAWRERFYEPLNLPSMYLRAWDPENGVRAHAFSGYFGVRDPVDITSKPDTALYSSVFAAAGGMASTADMARWTRALYRGEIFQKPESMQQLTNWVTSPGYGSGRAGLGTIEFSTSRGTFIGHFGDGWGYRCMAAHSTRHNVTVAFAINIEWGTEFTSWQRMVEGWTALANQAAR